MKIAWFLSLGFGIGCTSSTPSPSVFLAGTHDYYTSFRSGFREYVGRERYVLECEATRVRGLRLASACMSEKKRGIAMIRKS